MAKIVIYCDGGFGNRFNALISGLVAAELTGLEPEICWPANNWCGAEYADLFADAKPVSGKNLIDFIDSASDYLVLSHDQRNADYLKVPFHSVYNFTDIQAFKQFCDDHGGDVFYYPALIPTWIPPQNLVNTLNQLNFKKELRSTAEEFISKNFPEKYYGIHLRRTDLVLGFSDDEVEAILAQNPDKLFFICSDSAETEAKLAQFANARIRPKKAYVERQVAEKGWKEITLDDSQRAYYSNIRRSAESVHDAVIDLILLSKSEILGNTGSTFLNLARLLKHQQTLTVVKKSQDTREPQKNSSKETRMFSLVELVKKSRNTADPLETIGILDIGAMLLGNDRKEYMGLFEQKCARIVGFEPVEVECRRLNEEYRNTGMQFFPYFIGNGTKQKFFLTNYSMTASLYEPNLPLLDMFHNLGELTVPIAEETVETQKLDDIAELDFPIDFIKMDIQGAELQALEGAQHKILKNTLVIQTEVEWVPMYKNQPLFSEIEMFLRTQGFVLHKIMGFGTRSFKPIVIRNNKNVGPQQLWSDVIFIRDFTRLNLLSPAQLLKMAVIMHEVYQSVDLALIILQEYDKQRQTALSQEYLAALTGQSAADETAAAEPESQPDAPAPEPTDFVTLFSRGVEAFSQNRFELALKYFEQAITIKNDFAILWYNLGLTRLKLNQLQEAFFCINRCLELDPEYKPAIDLRNAVSAGLSEQSKELNEKKEPEADGERLITALQLHSQGRTHEAEKIFLEILRSDPDDYASLFSMGLIENLRQNHEKALRYFEACQAIKPDVAAVWYNSGIMQQTLKRHEQALTSYNRALELKPDYLEVMLNKGALLVEMQRSKDALLTYEDMLKVAPENEKALYNRGIILTHLNLNDNAIQTFEKLLEVAPESDYAAGLLCFAKMHACDWKNLEPLKKTITEGVKAGRRVCKTLAFTAISDSPQDNLTCAQTFTRHLFPTGIPVWQGKIYNHAKIRVAYMSPDFREHPVGYLTAGLFEAHDKTRFELYGISLGSNKPSTLRSRIQNTFDRFIDASCLSCDEVTDFLSSNEVDILVDLAGHTADARTEILARRPTPIQINYLGYSSTMGADYIDYIIADPHVIPEAHRDFYAEKVVHLPNSYMPSDDKLNAAEQIPTRREYGLPENGFVFCSFNHDYKISPEVFDIWMRLLKNTPGSVLWLMKLNEAAERNLRREAENRNIASNRLVFASRVEKIEDHLARYRLADLFLDTCPCNAHSTANDALKVGLPIVTCRGHNFAGRVAASLLTTLNMPELITDNLDEYEKVAQQLSSDAAALKSIAGKLQKNLQNSPLYSTATYCRNLEQAYEAMWQRYQQGKPPEHLVI